MSPKGGIKPHKRFSIKAKRSEVLFVDYIAEHLTPKGRAGIIVPEGIIFQSQTAYKDLRKILVENSLVAVVSLPAGVFNPYSNVKTSILILDKSLAKLSNTVAFFKVENDGFGLGAQRREVTGEQLTKVKIELELYLQAVRNQELTDNFELTLGLVVPKVKIAANGDYNFSGERYREGIKSNHSFPIVSLGDSSLFRVESGGTPKSEVEEFWNGGIAWATLVDLPPTDFISQINTTKRTISEKGLRASSAKMIPANSVIVSTRATIGRIAINRIPIATNQGFKNIIIEDSTRVIPEYLAFVITKLVPTMESWATGGTFKEISKSKFCELKIPLPPIAIQQEIVTEIENYQKVINGARAVIDNYRPHIPINSDWAMVELGELCLDFQNGANFSKEQMGKGTLFVNIKDLFSSGYIDCEKLGRVELTAVEVERKKVKTDDLLFVRSSVKEEGVGFPSLMTNSNETIVFCGFIIKCSPNQEVVLPAYLLYLLRTPDFRKKTVELSNRANITNISQDSLKSLLIPVPPIETQKAIVAEIEAEQTLVNANRELITRFEKKIQTTLNRIWGEE
jgi:type I restriction enzyme M protein